MRHTPPILVVAIAFSIVLSLGALAVGTTGILQDWFGTDPSADLAGPTTAFNPEVEDLYDRVMALEDDLDTRSKAPQTAPRGGDIPVAVLDRLAQLEMELADLLAENAMLRDEIAALSDRLAVAGTVFAPVESPFAGMTPEERAEAGITGEAWELAQAHTREMVEAVLEERAREREAERLVQLLEVAEARKRRLEEEIPQQVDRIAQRLGLTGGQRDDLEQVFLEQGYALADFEVRALEEEWDREERATAMAEIRRNTVESTVSVVGEEQARQVLRFVLPDPRQPTHNSNNSNSNRQGQPYGNRRLPRGGGTRR